MKRFFAIASLLFFSGMSAKAGLLVDPYFSYTTSGSADFSNGSSVTGSEIGARLGWNFLLGLGAGVDMSLSGKDTYSQSGVSIDTKPAYYGAFISYHFPILFRAYATYLISMKETATAGDYYSGTGTKIGFQYTGLPFVALGIEMFNGNYTKYNNGSDTTVSDKASRTNITLSVPFSL